MKIDFAGNVLCTGVGKSNPQGFTFDGSRSAQKTKPLRAASGNNLDRLQRMTNIGFTVCRAHGTIQAAEVFALTHEDSLSGFGLLTLTSDDGSHTDTTNSYILTTLSRVRVTYKGQLTFTTYQFEGGIVYKNKPAV